MNKIDRQSQMMDYLYDEMSTEERIGFEAWLAEHPDARNELSELQAGRNWLAEVEEVKPQPVIIDLAPKVAVSRKWWYRAGIAAAVLLALSLTNFQIRTDNGGLLLSFGNPAGITGQSEDVPSPTPQAQLAAWQQLLAHNHEAFEEKLLAMDSTWQLRFAGLKQENKGHWQQIKHSQAMQVEKVKQEFTEDQLPRLAGLMQQLQIEQQEELQLLLVEFWNTWQETRQTDLEHIDFKMSNLYQNVERNQQESEARVVNFIQKVAGND